MQTLPARTTDISPAELRRIVVAIVIGNGFVAYDFTVYSFAAVAIGNLFFPSSNPASSLLLSLATFGAEAQRKEATQRDDAKSCARSQ